MMNLPNKVTLSRLVLAVIFFVLVSFERPPWVLDLALGVFILACATDWVDGYLARRYKLITVFGRIADPLVDKVIVCGGFVLLAGRVSFVQTWMVIVLISREFLVSSIRGYAESRGTAFGAELAGKAKAVLQMIAVGLVVYFEAHDRLPFLPRDAAVVVATIVVYLAVAATVLSGLAYAGKARRAFAGGTGPEGAPP